ncbi:MAG: 2-C-methyl-D-erythritol 2,4-cyclodiphosphate synthase [Deltaproteobacteria bacterium]|nr:MAG: 2-C-methyl-D-erythritol 2,4-cyclodiphosphate synthase [Deltaproteobacteria bacterium]
MGPVAHSDGDVALHALMDAILGAAGLGDIGRLFPDTDPSYEGACSVDLLRKVLDLAGGHGLRLSSADITIVAQRPRLGDRLDEMAERLADVCGVARGRIGVKATTEEGLGVTGAGGAIAAHAVAVLVEG